MNQLSWIIYFAGVSESLSGFLTFFGFIFFFGPLVLALIAHLRFDDDEISLDRETPVNWRGKILSLGIVFFLLGNMMPPRDTVYAIAASEVGERVLQSPTGNKAVAALNAWLDKQIQDAAAPATAPTSEPK